LDKNYYQTLRNPLPTYFQLSPVSGIPSPEQQPSSTEKRSPLEKMIAAKALEISKILQDELLTGVRQHQKHGRTDRGTGNPVLGCLLRKVRQGHGDSQSSLAHRAGVHATTINKIESGHRGMSLATFLKIDDVYHGELREALMPLYVGGEPPNTPDWRECHA
jgi:DNA-binding XRE family transcriptional regulator